MINPIYSPDSKRYDNGMKYRRCGRSGILLPEVSLGLWHNFGDVNTFSSRIYWQCAVHNEISQCYFITGAIPVTECCSV